MLRIIARPACLFLFLLSFGVNLLLAQKRNNYEFYKDFPVYADSLLAQLKYPLAWGTTI